MRKYQSYKSSGVEWIGDIPSNWNVTKIKYTKKDTKDSFIDGDWIESKDLCDEGIRYITSGNIGEGKYKEQGKGYISEDTFNKLNCTEIFEGDLIISRLFLPVGRSCILPNLNNRVVTCVDNVVLRPKESLNKFYLNYQFNSNRYSEFTELISRGVTLTRISRGMLGNNSIVVPPLNEQFQIVKFLDEKTELIDKLISTKKRKISLLKEHRTSLINNVVTKGLNHDVKMKDSGIEWIGDIPEEWIINKLGRIVNTKQGIQVDYEEQKFIKEEGYLRFLRISDYTNSDEEPRYDSVLNSQNYQVKVDDIVMFRYGDSGKVVKGIEGLICNNLFTIKIKNNQIENNYLFTVLSSDIVYQLLRNSSDNPTLKQVSHTILNNFFIPIPPIQEQHQIVKYLSFRTKEIDDLIKVEQKKIDLLIEFRQSLISEVVTGKIKVTTNE